MRYLFALCFILISCSKNKSEKNETNNSLEIVEKKSRKTINIKNQLLHLKGDGRKSPENNISVYGQYTTDRFEENNKSVILDGISDYIEIENHPNVNSKKELTISIWYKPDSYKGIGQNAIVWKGSDKYEAPYCQYLFSAIGNLYPSTPAVFKFGLSIDGKFNQIQTKPNIWEPNKWYNIVGTYDGVKMILFVNGTLQNQRAIPGELNLYDTPVLIGKTPHKDFFTSGSYDDFRVFDRALTSGEIKILSEEM